MHKKVFEFLIIILYICAITFVSYAVDVNQEEQNIQDQDVTNSINEEQNKEINNLQQQKEEIQNKVLESQENLEIINVDLTNNLKQVQKMDENISQNQKTLDEVNINIENLSKSIKETENKLNIVTQKYTKQKDLLDQRLIAMYEMNETGYLDYVFASSNLSEFLSTYYLVTELTSYDMDLLETVDKEKQEIENNKKQLEEKKTKLYCKIIGRRKKIAKPNR